MNYILNTRTSLITGASSGIGLELAKFFARDHWNLVLVARNESALKRLADELTRQYGIKAAVLPADLSDPAAPKFIYDSLQRQQIVIDALVNNAGFGTHGKFAEIDEETELRELQVNITAVTHLTKLFLPDMLKRNGGRILNVASTAAFFPGPFMAVYYGSKAYVLSFSEAIATETAGTGVTVTTLCPGSTKTKFQERAGVRPSPLNRTIGSMHAYPVALAGYKGMLKGKRLVIPGMMNKLTAISSRIIPRKLALSLARKFNENR